MGSHVSQSQNPSTCCKVQYSCLRLKREEKTFFFFKYNKRENQMQDVRPN